MNFAKNILKLVYIGLLAGIIIFAFLPVLKFNGESKSFFSLFIFYIKDLGDTIKNFEVVKELGSVGVLMFVGYLLSGLFLIVIPTIVILCGALYLVFSFIFPMFIPGLADRKHDKLAEYSRRKRNRALSSKYKAFGYFGWVLFVLIFSNSYLSENLLKALENSASNSTSTNSIEFYLNAGGFLGGMYGVSGPLESTPLLYVMCALCLGAAIVGILALGAEKRDFD